MLKIKVGYETGYGLVIKSYKSPKEQFNLDEFVAWCGRYEMPFTIYINGKEVGKWGF